LQQVIVFTAALSKDTKETAGAQALIARNDRYFKKSG
jgi:hypothetical protein